MVALNNLAATWMSDDLPAAVAYASEGAAVAGAAGLSVWWSFNSTNLLISRGPWRLGRGSADAGHIELSPEDVNQNVWLVVSELVGNARHEEPVRDVATKEPAKGDDPIDIAWAWLAKALAAERTGDPSAATLSSDAAQQLAEVAGLWDDLVLVWPVALELAMRHDNAVALEALLNVLDQAKGLVPRGLVAHRHRVSGLLSRRAGRPEEAEQHLRAAVDHFEAWGARGFLARTQAELAQLLRLQGRHEEAAALNERAREWLRAARAEGWLQELDLQPADR